MNQILCLYEDQRQSLKDGGSLRENGLKVLKGKSGVSVKTEEEEIWQGDFAHLSRWRSIC